MLIRMVLREDNNWRVHDGLFPRDSYKDTMLEDMPEVLKRAACVMLARGTDVGGGVWLTNKVWTNHVSSAYWNSQHKDSTGWVKAVQVVDVSESGNPAPEIAKWFGKEKLEYV